VTDTEPLRFEREERAQVLLKAGVVLLASAFVAFSLIAKGEMSPGREIAVFLGAIGLGVLISIPLLLRVHAIVLEPDAHIAFQGVLRARRVPFEGIRAVMDEEDQYGRLKIMFMLKDGETVRLPDCEEFRMAAKYLKERHPRLDYALPKDVIIKSESSTHAISRAVSAEPPGALDEEPTDLAAEMGQKVRDGVVYRGLDRPAAVGRAITLPLLCSFLAVFYYGPGSDAGIIGTVVAASLGLFIGLGLSVRALKGVYEVTLTVDGQVVFSSLLSRRSIALKDIDSVRTTDPLLPRAALLIRLRDNREIRLPAFLAFRAAVKHMKDREPGIDHGHID